MNETQMKDRTKALGIRVIRMTEALPRGRAADVIARQIVRSATSVGSNYRAACRARSTAEFASKLAVVEEEADETGYWIELLMDTGLVKRERLTHLLREANEIVAMIVASIKTARSKKRP
jgi:four helix bundle protein